eukprot:2332741-Pyramimonas_sp.AAC.1
MARMKLNEQFSTPPPDVDQPIMDEGFKVGLYVAIKPLLSHLVTGKFNSSIDYLRTTHWPSTRTLSN